MACTTRETVTRTLGQFRKEGMDLHRGLPGHPSRARAAANTLLGIFYTFGAPKGFRPSPRAIIGKKGNRAGNRPPPRRQSDHGN